MTTVFSAKIRFSEAVALDLYGRDSWKWLQNVEIDESLPPVIGPKWVYAFRLAKARFRLEAALSFNDKAKVYVESGRAHLRGSEKLETSGEVTSVSFPLNANGAPSLWMFVTSGFPLSELALRELSRYTLSDRQQNGVYYAHSPRLPSQRMPVVDLAAKPIPTSERKKYHWGGSLFEDGKGGHIILAFDYLAIAGRFHARAYDALLQLLELSHPALAKDLNSEKAKSIEARTLKLTLARFLSGICRQKPELYSKFRGGHSPDDFMDECEEDCKQRNRDAQRAMAKHCKFIASDFFGLVCYWFLSSCSDNAERVLERICRLLDGLEYSPIGLSKLADPPDHFVQLLEGVRITDGPERKPKDYASFGRKQLKSVVEFATKFAPGFIVGSRMTREFGDILLLLWGNIEPNYVKFTPDMKTTVPKGSVGAKDLYLHISEKFSKEVGAKDLRDTIKSVSKAVDAFYWVLVIQDFVTKDNRDIYDHAKAASAINGALKTYLWEPWEKEAAAIPKLKSPGGSPGGNLNKNLRGMEAHLDDWMAARAGLGEVLDAAEKRSFKVTLAKRMLKFAPLIGAACDFVGAHGDYTKSRKEGDDTAAVAGLVGGLASGLAGLLALVPASWLSSSAFLGAFIPGVGWALLTVTATAAVVAWVATDDDWENLAEHTIFGRRHLLDGDTEPSYGFERYRDWHDSVEGLRLQLLSCYALLCRVTVTPAGEAVEIKLQHYESDMKLKVTYEDSLIGRKFQIVVDLATQGVEPRAEHLAISLISDTRGLRVMRLTPNWDSLISLSRQHITRIVTAHLEWSSGWRDQNHTKLPRSPVFLKETLQVERFRTGSGVWLR